MSVPPLSLPRKTKIVCTIGPTSNTSSRIEDLIKAGMNVARLNFSHSTHRSHGKTLRDIRRISSVLGYPVAILQDLPGPKLRTGRLKSNEVVLEPGSEFTLTTQKIEGDQHLVSVNFPSLPDRVETDSSIFLGDGTIQLKVESTTESEIKCEVIVGGVLSSGKGINLPGVDLGLASFTERDYEHLLFGVERGIDWVALSFIRRPSDVLHVKELLGMKEIDVPLVAKIEKAQALDNLADIVKVSDGVMVARGDLGVEIPIQQVPLAQKEIIRECNRQGKPVIVATQMLESMVHSPYPTRAEATDIANAILDGADAIMLSEETAIGDYPVESVQLMDKIARETEANLPYHHALVEKGQSLPPQISDAISYSACRIAQQLGAAAIVAYTTSGSTAQRVSKYRPAVPVLAATLNEVVQKRMALWWGLQPHLAEAFESIEQMYAQASSLASQAGLAEKGKLIVIVAGSPTGVAGTTNLLRVQRID